MTTSATPKRCWSSARASRCRRIRTLRSLPPKRKRGQRRCRFWIGRRHLAARSSPQALLTASSIRRCRPGSPAAPAWNAARCSFRARTGARCRPSFRSGARSSSNWDSGAFAGASTSIRSASPETGPGRRWRRAIIQRFVERRRSTANPLTDLKSQLAQWLSAGLARIAPEHVPSTILLERPKQAQYGDYSSNVALQLSKALKRNPRELAAALIAVLETTPLVARTEVAGAGFINVFVSVVV